MAVVESVATRLAAETSKMPKAVVLGELASKIAKAAILAVLEIFLAGLVSAAAITVVKIIATATIPVS